VEEFLKKWEAAESMQDAVAAAKGAAEEYDGLYEDSAKNLLARKPTLMMLLAAFLAGRERGVAEEADRHRPVQEVLDA
jgi:hypothetical protein